MTFQNTDPVIVTEALTRTFTTRKHTVEAVRGLDLEIRRGELVAFLGPNGAGKSTTLRMLTTLLAPSSGTARVAGFDVIAQQGEVRRSIGYVGQGNGAGHQQRGRDELVSQGRAYGLSKDAARARAEELIEALQLGAAADRKVSTLSGGQRRRLDIALGLVNAPEVLFLDEPSTGLDPQNRANLQSQVERLHAETGNTIVLTTHYLEEADALAERVIVIDHGRVVADDSAYELKSGLGDRVMLGFADVASATAGAERAARIPGAQVERDGTRVVARIARGNEVAPQLIHDLHVDGHAPTSVEVVLPTLDDVFLELTGRSLREANESIHDADHNDTEEVAA